MDTRLYPLLGGAFVLWVASVIYGVKFLKKGNYPLGLEWFVMALSASAFLLYLLAAVSPALVLSLHCDAFSRSVGIPVITVAGLMAVTHRYKPSVAADTAMFGSGIVVAVLLMNVGFFQPIKPYIYVAEWIGFSLYLSYFAKRLWAAVAPDEHE